MHLILNDTSSAQRLRLLSHMVIFIIMCSFSQLSLFSFSTVRSYRVRSSDQALAAIGSKSPAVTASGFFRQRGSANEEMPLPMARRNRVDSICQAYSLEIDHVVVQSLNFSVLLVRRTRESVRLQVSTAPTDRLCHIQANLAAGLQRLNFRR